MKQAESLPAEAPKRPEVVGNLGNVIDICKNNEQSLLSQRFGCRVIDIVIVYMDHMGV